MKEMRRADRQMSEKETLELLEKGEYGILSTVNGDNEPYGIPLSYVLVNSNLYFHCATEGSKIDNIKNNDKVCFTVVGRTKVLPDKFSTEYESAVVFGRADIVEGEEKILALREIIKKYSPDYISEGEEYITRAKDRTLTVKIVIENLSGKHRN